MTVPLRTHIGRFIAFILVLSQVMLSSGACACPRSSPTKVAPTCHSSTESKACTCCKDKTSGQKSDSSHAKSVMTCQSKPVFDAPWQGVAPFSFLDIAVVIHGAAPQISTPEDPPKWFEHPPDQPRVRAPECDCRSLRAPPSR